ncbi:thioredoxin family protein [Halobacteriovorax sp. GB3]|uniref:thioredoxin family protein n=1 Tax=Halobacteriovorax sp. GB3 TaxID=2719615 RepID=UPI0023622311|nr:thioredoxin family protein [Halobacteriovorax sp. GB3]MDD0853404.1 thioredoxin family protein [Halobacteriovorax sp. GB3]
MDHQLTLENFEATVQAQQRPYVIQFFSTTCGPCQTMKPVIEKLRAENDSLNVFTVNTNEEPEISAHFGIRSVPTIHVCEGREILYSFHGVTPFRDLQFVLENIDDIHFRTTGEFKRDNEKKDYTFSLIVIGLLAIFIGLFVFLPK